MNGKIDMKKQIILTPDLLIAAGHCRKTFLNPENAGQVIKINHAESDGNERELMLYKTLPQNILALCPRFYGTVETNLGQGLCFERIVDYDTQKPSETLLKLLQNNVDFVRLHKTQILDAIKRLTAEFANCPQMTCGLNIENIVIQRASPSEIKIFSIDMKMLTVKEAIPLSKLFSFFRTRKIRRRLKRNLDFLTQTVQNL